MKGTMTSAHESRMSPRRLYHKKTPSEVWDEDFEFQENEGQEPGPSRRPMSGVVADVVDPLRAWSESPMSNKARGKQVHGAEENWDDDFVDKLDSPVRTQHRRGTGVRRATSPPAEDQENWDEDFEMGMAPRPSLSLSLGGVDASPSSKRSRNDASWDSSDEEMNGEEAGFGRRGSVDEEDKTVTARSRRRPLGTLNTGVPPVPPLPPYLPTVHSGGLVDQEPSPFPRSPTLSVFSIPTTTGSGGRDRDSVGYGSTAHLRRTHSAGSSSPSHPSIIVGRFPPVSPNRAPRERRRLRKKSRPPHLDGNIMELEDRSEPTPKQQQTESTLGPYAYVPFRPVTPENRPGTPPPDTDPPSSTSASPMAVDPVTPSLADSSTSVPPTTTKSPLLARIGSVKRWGAGGRRKRASTGPAEVIAAAPPSAFVASVDADRYDNNTTPRPHSYVPPSATPPPSLPAKRFFRDSYSGPVEAPPRTCGASGSREPKELRKVKSKAKLRDEANEQESRLPSPRTTRMRGIGQKLIPVAVKSHSPDRQEKGEEGDGDVHVGLSSTPQPITVSNTPPQTPSRLRPRLPSNTQGRSIFPRHVSASAATQEWNVGLAPGPSTRSISYSVPPREDGESSDKKDGSRGFMGSMRRISLVGGQKRHKRGKSGGVEDMMEPPSLPPVPVIIPPLPDVEPIRLDTPVEFEREPVGSGLLPAVELVTSNPISIGPPRLETKITTSMSLPIDLNSPNEFSSSPPNPVLDRLPNPPRRPGPGEPPSLSHSKSSSFATPSPSRAAASAVAKLTASPQAASLGRASQLPASASSASNVHRRNSLGDLKIPSRISKAQDGLKRDLTRVREFATHVEQMKDLRLNYYNLATQVQNILELPRPPSRATSPNIFNFSRPVSRARSNTNPPPPPRIDYAFVATSFRAIDSKYRIAWECAELLIDLGSGAASEATPSPPPLSSGLSKLSPSPSPEPGRHKNRERAVTLAGDEGKPVLSPVNSKALGPPLASPPALLSWRASTGRHDLNHRQLFLLKEMLNNAESAKEGVKLDIPDPAPTVPQWRWPEGMDSTMTLPTEESASASGSSPQKKRPASRLGMTGLRDMLRSLKRNSSRASQPEGAQSSTTLSTESSLDIHSRNVENHPYTLHNGLPVAARSTGRRRSKTSTGPESVRSTNGGYPHNPYMSGISLTHRSSPRRPSLASLFRLGQKHKGFSANSTDQSLDKQVETAKQAKQHDGRPRSTTEDEDEESDWDRMDSASDIDVRLEDVVNGDDPKGTLKLRKKKRILQHNESPSRSRPVTPKHPFNASQVSLGGPSDTPLRATRLSNVDENNATTSSPNRQSLRLTEGKRPKSRGKDRPTSASVRSSSVKPISGLPVFDIAPIPDLKLAMTPENIKPLLENARVVSSRLKDCVSEVKELLARIEIS